MAAGLSDAAAKDAVEKQIDTWQKTAQRYEFGSEVPGRPQGAGGESAKDAEAERELSTAKYHHYELASAAFQVGIVLASAAVITGMVALVWFGGLLGVVGPRSWRSGYSRRTRCRLSRVVNTVILRCERSEPRRMWLERRGRRLRGPLRGRLG